MKVCKDDINNFKKNFLQKIKYLYENLYMTHSKKSCKLGMNQKSKKILVRISIKLKEYVSVKKTFNLYI